jgi:hypothetical protein
VNCTILRAHNGVISSFILLVFSGLVSADVIYESATMGTAGLTDGFGITSSQHVGSRFSIAQTTQITAIGGHMLQSGSGTLFGAIVELSSGTDFSNGFPMSGSDVVASTVFDPGFPGSDYRVALSVTLVPGDYALIFGTNAFGAANGTGSMAQPSNQVFDPNTSFFASSGGNWLNYYPFYPPRFVVEGFVDPNATDPNYRSVSAVCDEYISRVEVGRLIILVGLVVPMVTRTLRPFRRRWK